MIALAQRLPRMAATWRTALPAGPALIARGTVLPRPPSLLVLCIGRT